MKTSDKDKMTDGCRDMLRKKAFLCKFIHLHWYQNTFEVIKKIIFVK